MNIIESWCGRLNGTINRICRINDVAIRAVRWGLRAIMGFIGNFFIEGLGDVVFSDIRFRDLASNGLTAGEKKY